MNKDLLEIGKRLKRWRKSKAITQNELAETLDIKRGSVSSIEVGTNIITTKSLIKLHEVYQLSSDYLLFGEEQKDLPDFGIYNEKIKEMLQEMKAHDVYLHSVLGCFFQKKFELENLGATEAKDG